MRGRLRRGPPCTRGSLKVFYLQGALGRRQAGVRHTGRLYVDMGRVRRLYVDMRPACMQRSAAPCPPAPARDRPRAARCRCCRRAGLACSGRQRGWGRRGWLGVVPHHAVLRRQSARSCLDLHAAGLAWVGAQAAASAGRWRASASAQGCEAAVESVMQAGSAGAACAAQAQQRLPVRRPLLRKSEQACMRRAGALPARVALAPCLVPWWAAPAGVLLGGMAPRACGGGAWRVAGFSLCQHALWVLRGRPRMPTPVWRAPRHLCKSSSLAVF